MRPDARPVDGNRENSRVGLHIRKPTFSHFVKPLTRLSPRGRNRVFGFRQPIWRPSIVKVELTFILPRHRLRQQVFRCFFYGFAGKSDANFDFLQLTPSIHSGRARTSSRKPVPGGDFDVANCPGFIVQDKPVNVQISQQHVFVLLLQPVRTASVMFSALGSIVRRRFGPAVLTQLLQMLEFKSLGVRRGTLSRSSVPNRHNRRTDPPECRTQSAS